MNEEDTGALLREVVERQRAMEQRLSAIEAVQAEIWKMYESSDAAYRTELSNYQKDRTGIADARVLAAVMRALMLLLLVYVAYRVS